MAENSKDRAKIDTKLVLARHEALDAIQAGMVELEQLHAAGTDLYQNADYSELIQYAVYLGFSEIREAGAQVRQVDGTNVTVPTLRADLEVFAERLAHMRLKLSPDPEDRAKVTGAFIQAIANSQDVRGVALQDQKVAAANQLLQNISTDILQVTDISDRIKLESPEVRLVMSQLRENHYINNAARQFWARYAQKPGFDEFLSSPITSVAHLVATLIKPSNVTNHSYQQIRDLIPEDQIPAFDDVVAHARAAAKARDEYDLAIAELGRATDPVKAQAAQRLIIAANQGEVTLGPDGQLQYPALAAGQPDPRNDQARQTATENEGACFTVARLAKCVHNLMQEEISATGGHSITFPGAHNPTAIGSQLLLALTGVTRERALEVFDTVLVDTRAIETFADFGSKGIQNIKDLKKAVTSFRKKTKGVLNREMVQTRIKAQASQDTLALLNIIDRDVRSDAQRTIRELAGNQTGATNQMAQMSDDLAFQRLSETVKEALFGPRPQQRPSALGAKLNQLKVGLVQPNAELQTAKADLSRHVTETEAARLRLATAQLPLDNLSRQHKKSVVRVARRIANAEQLRDEIAQINTPGLQKKRATKQRQLDRLMVRLSHVNKTTLRVERGNPAGPTDRILATDIQANSPVVSLAQDVITVDRSPARRAMLERRVALRQKNILRILYQRQIAAPAHFNAVNRIIYAAILESLPNNVHETIRETGSDAGYQLTTHERDAVRAKLTYLGIGQDEFGPEIDHALETPLNGTVVSQLYDDIKEVGFSELLGLAKTSANEGRGIGAKAYTWVTDFKKIEDRTRADLNLIVNSLEPKQSYSLNAGSDLTIDSYKLGIDPGAANRIRFQLGVNYIRDLTIARDAEGRFKISCTGTGGGKFGFQYELAPLSECVSDAAQNLQAGEWVKNAPYLRVGFKATLDVHHKRSGGFELTFSEGDDGKAAALDFLTLMTQQTGTSAHLLVPAQYVMSEKAKETGLTVNAGGMVLAGFFPTMDPLGFQPIDEDSGARPAFDLGLEARGGLRFQEVRNAKTSENLKRREVSFETERYASLAGYGEIYLGALSLLGIGTSAVMQGSGGQSRMDSTMPADQFATNGNGYYDQLRADIKVDFFKKHQQRNFVYERVGEGNSEVLTEASLTEVTPASRVKEVHQAQASHTLYPLTYARERILHAFPKEILANFKAAPDSQLANRIKALIDKVTKDSSLEVIYKLKSDKLKAYNELQKKISDCPPYSRMDSVLGSKRLQYEAEKKMLLADNENYTVSRIRLVETTSNDGMRNRGRAAMAMVYRTAGDSTTACLDQIDFI